MKKIFLLLVVIAFSAAAQIDRSKMPEAGAAPKIEIAEYESFQLKNGLRVFVIEDRKLPIISFSLVIDRDPVLEGTAAGYVTAAGELLRTGTKTRSKDQLDQQIDYIGAVLNTSAGGLFASSLKKHADTLLTLMSDIILNADFKQEQLDKILLRMESDLAMGKDDPNTIASNVRKVLLYGKEHPYGELTTEETLKNVTLEKCSEYYNTYFKPNISYLAIVGDISLSEAKKLTEKYFGGWQSGDVPHFVYDKPNAPGGVNPVIVDRPNSVQSVINVTYPVQLKLGDPDDIKARVTNTILGGGVFRLFNNLREKHSYTYGAYSILSNDRLSGYFNAFADVRNAVTDSAVTEILYEMKRLREEPVGEEELRGVKNYLTGNFVMSLESAQTIAGFAINIARYNLPSDYYSNYLKRIEAVTADDVMKAAGKYIQPDNNYILVVGNGDDIKQKLSKFGEVAFYDRFGNREDTTPAGDALNGITAEAVIENYISVIGGREKLAAVEDRTTEMSGKVQGIDISMTVYQKAPDLYRQEVKAGAMNQEIIFDGSKAVMKAGGQTIPITGPELEKLKFEATLPLLLKLEEFGIKLLLKGVSKAEGTDAYRVDMILPDSTRWIQYYDKETGLKLKEEKTLVTPQGAFNQETIYSDYREVDGLKFPFSIKQSMGPQVLQFEVKSIKINSGVENSKFSIE